ncbi:hypothetical protein AB849_004585 [Thermoactinomyces vulgaris]|nr:hypothetical protein AB849_004585 [Thermoactinomyces vulgaris]
MNIIEYYLLLRLQYQEYRCHQSFYVSLNELARVLCCSTRNVKRLLRKMVDDQLIFFKPGGGRGKRSKLQFRRPLHHVFPLYIQIFDPTRTIPGSRPLDQKRRNPGKSARAVLSRTAPSLELSRNSSS